MMVYRQFPADVDLDILARAGFTKIQMRVFRAAAKEGHHPYCFAQKP
jgi:hypothetical protein